MTVREKLQEVKNQVLSVGIEFSDVDFIEFTEEEFNTINNNILDKEIEKFIEFKDDPTYVEIICKY